VERENSRIDLMPSVFLALPTDNLYKFLALFGLVLFLFAVFFPEEKFAKPVAEMQEANKARQIAKIRIDRKNAEIRDALKQVEDKSAELKKNQQLLNDTKTTLETKRRSLMEQVNQQMKRRNPTLKAAKEVEAQAEGLNPEVHALSEQVHGYSDNVRKNSEAIQALRARVAEVSDETAIELVNMKAFSESVSQLWFRIKLWNTVAYGSAIIGVVMMMSGFRLWHKRVQIHQDAILRKQADDIKAEKTA
jgi:uncharacterized protein YoxC